MIKTAPAATADEIYLPDGTTLEIKETGGSTWTPVADPLSIPEIGDAAEFVNVESISDTAPKYKATTGESEDFAIQCNYVEADGTRDPGQVKLIAAAKAKAMTQVRITIPGVAKALEFSVTWGAWKFDALEKRTAVKISFSGRKNGEIREVVPASQKETK